MIIIPFEVIIIIHNNLQMRIILIFFYAYVCICVYMHIIHTKINIYKI